MALPRRIYIGWRGPGYQSVVTAVSARKDGFFLFVFVLAGLARSSSAIVRVPVFFAR